MSATKEVDQSSCSKVSTQWLEGARCTANSSTGRSGLPATTSSIPAEVKRFSSRSSTSTRRCAYSVTSSSPVSGRRDGAFSATMRV